MKRTLALVAALALGGCASAPEYIDSDFTYRPLEKGSDIGFDVFSEQASRGFKVTAQCERETSEYVITPYVSWTPAKPKPWVVRISGQDTISTYISFEDEKAFVAAAQSIEVAKRLSTYSYAKRIKMPTDKIQDVVQACRKKNQAWLSMVNSVQTAEKEKNESRIDAVVRRTGLQPMFKDENHMNLTGVAFTLVGSGFSQFEGRFFWAEAGDYQVVQVRDGAVVLLSQLYPQLPTAIILMNTSPEKGKSSFPMYKKPLQLVGLSTYETPLGIRKPAMILKEI